MAKSLAERLIAAKSPRARLNDNEVLLADLKAERDRLNAARDEAAGQSIDFALSDDDRDEAATKAGRYERTAKALETEIGALAVLIEKRRDEEAAQRAEANCAEVRAERDALAKEFGEKMPRIIDEITDLFGRVNANASRLIAIGDRNGCAEAKARGVAGFVDPLGLRQYTKMVIPGFKNVERAWPPVERALTSHFYDAGAAIENARRDREQRAKREAEAAAKFARENGLYRLSTAFADYRAVDIPAHLRELAPILPHKVTNATREIEYTLPHTVAEQLTKIQHLGVQRLDRAPA